MTIFREFVPIAERDLILVGSDGYEMPVHVAVGAPYEPADAKEMEGYAGCQVLACDDSRLATEVLGADKMEALVAALEFIESFLKQMVVEAGGPLKTIEGQHFDPSGSALLKASRRLQSRRDKPGRTK
jgi:hypothetical protein